MKGLRLATYLQQFLCKPLFFKAFNYQSVNLDYQRDSSSKVKKKFKIPESICFQEFFMLQNNFAKRHAGMCAVICIPKI